MKKFKISVVIPTKNNEKTIKQTLNSILTQITLPDEIIVVDDKSEDKTLQVLKAYNKKIKIIKNKKNLGPASSRNKGIKRAKGDIIFFTDADCKVPKNWIKEILKHYTNEKIAGVGGYLKPCKNNFIAKLELLQNKFILGIRNEKIIDKAKTPTGYTNNISYRKKVLKEVEGFNEKFPFPAGEDIDLKKRICDKNYQIVYIPLPVIHLEKYDLNYLLKRIFIRTLNRNPKKSLFINSLIILFGLPLIILNTLKKIIKYKLKKVL